MNQSGERPTKRPWRVKSLVGQRFGRLTALQRRDDGLYDCICECGTKSTVRRENLTTGNTRSCGCLRVETIRRTKRKPNSRQLAIARYYKRNAKVSGRAWALSQQELERIIASRCHYCGVDPSLGIDRLDSSQGYVWSNVAPCCASCNRAKLTMTEAGFYCWLERTVNNLIATGRMHIV